jgi:hypothetical protein
MSSFIIALLMLLSMLLLMFALLLELLLLLFDMELFAGELFAMGSPEDERGAGPVPGLRVEQRLHTAPPR